MGETSVHANVSETDANTNSNTNSDTSNVMTMTTASVSKYMEPIYDEKGGAAYCGCKTPTLRKRRREGKGPPYIKIGRLVRYRQSDLDAFLEKHLQKPEAKKEPNAQEK